MAGNLWDGASKSCTASKGPAQHGPVALTSGCREVWLDGEEGVIQHSLLVLLLQERKMQKGGKKKKSIVSSRAGGWKNSPTNPTFLTREKKNGRNTSNMYWNQHYTLHDKQAQENIQWELILYRVYFISPIAFLFHPKGVNMSWLGFRHYTSKQTLSFWFPCKAYFPSTAKTWVVVLLWSQALLKVALGFADLNCTEEKQRYFNTTEPVAWLVLLHWAATKQCFSFSIPTTRFPFYWLWCWIQT